MDAVTDALDPAVDPALDPAPMREQYHTRELTERDLAAHPMEQFARWFADAAHHGEIHEPNAMAVATATPTAAPRRAPCC